MRRLIFIVLICCTTFMYGQETSIKNIRAIKLKNVGTLMDGGEGNGYYAFYEVEKKDKKTRAYSVKFLDANMNEIGKKTITGTKFLSLVDGEYNGDNLFLKFIDIKESEITYRQYSKSGELLSKITEEVKYKELQVNTQTNSLMENSTGILSVEGKGFLSFLNRKYKKWGYEVRFFPNSKDDKGWTFTSDKNSKEIETVSFLGSNDEIALLSVTRRPGLMSKKMDFYMLGIDTNTGEKLFEKKMSDGKNSIMVTSTFFDENTDEVTLMGYYYESAEKVMSGKSKGMIIKKMNKKGEYIFDKKLSWASDLGKKLPVDAKGKLDGKGFLYFHEMTKNAEGNYFLVAEQYKKTANAGGIAAGIAASLSGNVTSNIGMANIVTEDLYILEFSPKFELLSAEVFEKNKSKVNLPQGYEFVNISLLGAFIDLYGGFDFSFLQRDKNEDVFSVVYYDYDKEAQTRNIHTLTRVDGEFADDKIKLESAGAFSILPNKHGSIGIVEYFSKERTLNFRTEKFNY